MGCWRDKGAPRKLKHLLKVFSEKQNQRNGINCIFIIFIPSMWSILSVFVIFSIFIRISQILKRREDLFITRHYASCAHVTTCSRHSVVHIDCSASSLGLEITCRVFGHIWSANHKRFIQSFSIQWDTYCLLQMRVPSLNTSAFVHVKSKEMPFRSSTFSVGLINC